MEHPPSAGHGTAFCKLLQRRPSRKTHDATPMGGVIGPASRPAGRSSLASSTSCGRTSLLGSARYGPCAGPGARRAPRYRETSCVLSGRFIRERSGVCSSCMRVAFPHLVSPPILRWSVTPLGYLTIRMLSAGVGASGRVCRPVPHCPRRPQWPGIPPGRHSSFTSAQAEDTQGRPMVRMLRAESRALVDRRATMRRREVERRPDLMRAGRLGSPIEARKLTHS